MDIHPPEGPTHSLRDFAIHILVVTIGILIALSLEGVRESWREHKAIAEAREAFREEIEGNRNNLKLDMESFHKVEQQADEIVKQMPELAKHPDELRKQVDNLKPGFYFYRTRAWETAASGGALAHMTTSERSRYADVYTGLKSFEAISGETFKQYIEMETYYGSHHSYTGNTLPEAEQRLRLLHAECKVLQHIGEQLTVAFDQALAVK